jgi:N-acetylmuramoyl-L-alanine amidase
MPKLYLIAGHAQGKDEGAQNLKTKETENLIARDLILQVFPQVRDAVFTDICPFDLKLEEQTSWVNKRAGSDDVVLCCHLNSSPYRTETGAMCFYYGGSQKSKEMAEKLLDAYCRSTGLKNAGVHPDTSSRFGRLGIVRDTRGWAFLIELGSINNDLETVKTKSVAGLLAGIQAILGKAEDKPFADVDRTHPYFSAVDWAKKRGVAEGYGDGRLGVDETLTVGRFLGFLRKYDDIQKMG